MSVIQSETTPAHWKWDANQRGDHPNYPYFPWNPIRAGDKVYILDHRDLYVTTGVKQFNGLIGVRNERTGKIEKVAPFDLLNASFKASNTIQYVDEDQKPENCVRKGDEKVYHYHDMVIERNTYQYNKDGTLQLAICSRCDLHQYVWVYTSKQTKDKDTEPDANSTSNNNNNNKRKAEEDEDAVDCVCGGKIKDTGICIKKTASNGITHRPMSSKIIDSLVKNQFKTNNKNPEVKAEKENEKEIVTGGELMNSLVKKQFKSPIKRRLFTRVYCGAHGCEGELKKTHVRFNEYGLKGLCDACLTCSSCGALGNVYQTSSNELDNILTGTRECIKCRLADGTRTCTRV